MQYTKLSKPSLLERMKPQSLLERLSDPTSQCSTTGTEIGHLAKEYIAMKSEKIQDIELQTPEREREKRKMKLPKKMSAMNLYTNDPKLTWAYSHGPLPIELEEGHCEMSVLQPRTLLLTTRSISNSPKHISSTQDPPLSSQTWSGSQSCQVYLSISTQSSAATTQQNMTKKSHMKSETLPSPLERLQHPKLSDQQVNGSSHGPKQQQQQPSLSHIKVENAKNMVNTYSDSSQPLRKNTTTSYSTMTEQPVNVLPFDETYFLLTSPTLGT
jgi:hypothetical protein